MRANGLWHKWSINDPWIRYRESYDSPTRYQSSSYHGNQDGKYLFFSTSQQALKELIEYEISNHGFKIAKVIDRPKTSEYVACLYWTGDERKYELAERYKDRSDIKYRYYKKNSDTLAGKYSKQFKDSI